MAYPIKLNTRTAVVEGALISNLPALFVDTTVLVPLIFTLTPGRGRPFSSVTVP
ncbi:hypothetical protein D3C85_1415880 [compost metagenome]